MPKHLFCLKYYLIVGQHGQEEHKETRGTLGCSRIGLYLAVRAAYGIKRAFRSVFRFVSDNISDHFCIFCTQTAFFIEKQKALGDFQIIFQIFFASFVPDLIESLLFFLHARNGRFIPVPDKAILSPCVVHTRC